MTNHANLSPGRERDHSIGEIAILTCGRPHALARVLHRYAGLVGGRPTLSRLTVYDDSTRTEDVAANVEAIREVQRRRGVSVWYAGRADRLRFARALEQGGCSPAAAKFALLGGSWNDRTAGCNRNAVLLESAGRVVLSVDDDTDPTLRPAPHRVAGLRLMTLDGQETDPVFPNDVWVVEMPVAPYVAEPPTCIDVHERLLGRDVGECVAAFTAAGEPVTTDAAAEAVRLRERKVRITLPGLVGDCGWRSPAPYLFLTGRSRAALTQSPKHYRAACSTRRVLRVSESFAIVDRAMNMMGTFFGIDGRALLPPFPPIGRGQDVVFGILVSACVADSCFGHLPWAMLHEPVEQRHFRAADVVCAALGTDLCVVTAAVIRVLAADNPPGDERSMQQLGRRLAALGELQPDIASRVIRSAVMALVGEQFAALDADLTRDDAAPCWAADARRALALWRQAAAQQTYHLPVECLKGADAAHALTRCVCYLESFGHLLEEWPRLVRTSVRLRESGSGLATPAGQEIDLPRSANA